MSKSLKFILFGFCSLYLSCKSFGMDNTPAEEGQKQKNDMMQKIIVELDKTIKLQHEEISELRKQADILEQNLEMKQTESSEDKRICDTLQKGNAELTAILTSILLYGTETPIEQRQNLLFILLMSLLHNIKQR